MTKILITGVGGGVGQSIIKALQTTSYELVGVDSEKYAVGLHSLSKAYLGRYANDPGYIDRLVEICEKEECRLIFPGHDVELKPLSENINTFAEKGIIPIVSTPEVIRLCDDKMETNIFLRSQGLPAPETFIYKDKRRDIHFPVVMKPQKGGARARNVFTAFNQKEYDAYKQLIDPDNCIIQEFIKGDEYTCGSVTLDGDCKGVIIMKRILRDGDTYKAFVDMNDELERFVSKLISQLNPFGACNVQLRVQNGIPYVFEINARCSGTTAARSLAGFNEPKMIADYVLAGIKPEYSIRSVSIFRYWNELVVENNKIDALEKNGYLYSPQRKL